MGNQHDDIPNSIDKAFNLNDFIWSTRLFETVVTAQKLRNHMYSLMLNLNFNRSYSGTKYLASLSELHYASDICEKNDDDAIVLLSRYYRVKPENILINTIDVIKDNKDYLVLASKLLDKEVSLNNNNIIYESAELNSLIFKYYYNYKLSNGENSLEHYLNKVDYIKETTYVRRNK